MLKISVTLDSSSGGTRKTSRNARISSSVTTPSAFASLAPSTMTPMVKATSFLDFSTSPSAGAVAASVRRSTACPAAVPRIAPNGPPSASPAAPPMILPQMLM